GVSGLTPVTLGNSDSVRVGQQVVAFGSPLGLGGTVTTGIISALNRAVSVGEESGASEATVLSAVQTDAAINPGNSGGPLLDDGGKVIGVNSQIATNGVTAGNVGIGFAVPSNTVRQVLPGLKLGRTVTHAWLGVKIDTTGATAGSATPSSGAVIGSVSTGGPAEDAGLQSGDVVTQIDGQKIEDSTGLSSYVNTKAPGDKITLTVQRNGQTEQVDVTLKNRPAQVP
ncbi:MAG TPA: PDZ domain-containing protein, partial [Baekduia sp.]|nr:PDZ domain-containing protein [Baekduia sp.]